MRMITKALRGVKRKRRKPGPLGPNPPGIEPIHDTEKTQKGGYDQNRGDLLPRFSSRAGPWLEQVPSSHFMGDTSALTLNVKVSAITPMI